MNKQEIFNKALELTKAQAEGGSVIHLASVFEATFDKLIEIAQKEGLLM